MFGLKLKNFQSFDDVGAGIDNLKRINLLIGANNSGKSKILHAIERVSRAANSCRLSKLGPYTVEIKRTISNTEKDILNRIAYTSISGINTEAFEEILNSSEIEFNCHPGGNDLVELVVSRVPNTYKQQEENSKSTLLSTYKKNYSTHTKPLDGLNFSETVYFIHAERDIKPEPASASTKINPDGSGITNAVRFIISDANTASEPVEENLLRDLNAILNPDYTFDRINIQQHEDRNFEIYLHEKGKGRIPLSQCGSGLKTIIHILSIANITLKSEDGKISDGVYLFEELENCLHPRAQRAIYDYIYRTFQGNCRVFLTTHSTTCLDYFQGKADVSLTHVYQENGKTRSRTVAAFSDNCHTLDSLGAKASDILQTNAMIWVEGPSDRIYLKNFFSLLESGLIEGRDYSIMFYGGKILSHLTLDEDNSESELVRLLKINRNSAVVIDSDKKSDVEKLNATKERICSEAEIYKMITWVTEGKEIENYISHEFLSDHFNIDISQLSPQTNPWSTLENRKAKSGTVVRSKVDLADYVREHASYNDFSLDWKNKATELMEFIRSANA